MSRRATQNRRPLRIPAGTPSTIAAPTAGVQYSEALTLTVPGSGFTTATVISLDGVAQTTTFVSSTAVTIPIPTARQLGSPLRTAGAKTLTANTGGSATWTVNAWSEIDEATCTGLWIASSANCAGATTLLQTFTPWTDLNGSADLTQGGGSGSQPYYVPAASTASAWSVPSLYIENPRTLSRATQTINGATYLVIIGVNQFLNNVDRQVVSWAGGARRLFKPTNQRYLQWQDTPNGGGGAANVQTGVLGGDSTIANWAIYSCWREADDTVHMQANADAEFTSSSCNDSSGDGGTMVLGDAVAESSCLVPYISTWSSDPGATVRARARNKAMILTGLCDAAPTSGRVAHYRADLGITLNGSDVSAWADQSGLGDANKNATQSTAGLQPLFVASSSDFNNQPVVRFTAANGDTLVTGTWASSAAQPNTVYVAYKAGSAAATRALLDGIGASARHAIQNEGTTGYPLLFAGSQITSASNKASTRTYLCAVVNGASSAVYLDDFATAAVSGNAGAHGLDGLTIGSNYLGGLGLDGDIAEILVYAGAHSAEERAIVLAHFRNRYGT